MTDYDCSPHPLPESIVRHTARAVHNLFHPHHKHFYVAPMALMCHEPQMETVTVTASADTPPDGSMPPDTSQSYGYGASGFYSGGGFNTESVIGADSHQHPVSVSVPEPAAVLLMPLALLAVWLARRTA